MLDQPEGVCCVGRKVFVCDRPRHVVLAFNDAVSTCGWQEHYRLQGHGMFEPMSIAERDGDVFVGCACPPHAAGGAPPGVLVFASLDGTFVRRITHPLLREARGLAFVRDHLVVSEYDSRAIGTDRVPTRLLVFTPCGQLRQVVDGQKQQWRSLYGCAAVGAELHAVDTGAGVIRVLRAD
jgi:hypothetical protein